MEELLYEVKVSDHPTQVSVDHLRRSRIVIRPVWDREDDGEAGVLRISVVRCRGIEGLWRNHPESSFVMDQTLVVP